METNLVKQESSGGTVTYVLKEKVEEFNLEVFEQPQAVPKKKPLFLVKRAANKKLHKEKQDNDDNDEFKTLLEIINDTESGIPIAPKDKQLTDLKSINTAGQGNNNTFNKSRKSSNISYSQSNNSELFSIKTDKDNINFLKPKVFIENGKVRIERPTMEEVNHRLQEEQRKNAFVEFNEKNKISSLSFKKRLHSDKWDDEETKFFYKCLESFGTDFSILEIVLHPRNRNQIKNKYRKEEKLNSRKIENALKKFDPKKLFKLVTIIKFLQNKKTEEPINYQKLLNDEIEIDENFDKELNNILIKKDRDEDDEDEEEENEDDEDDIEDDEDNKSDRNSMTLSDDKESVKKVNLQGSANKTVVKEYDPDAFLDNFK
jgi:hypothetical protein